MSGSGFDARLDPRTATDPGLGFDLGPGAAGTVELPVAPDRTLVMGVLNVTPDSFSDGGEFDTVEAALAHARRMLAPVGDPGAERRGADIIDVGGESTRPGAERVDPAEERRRVIPIVRALAAEGIPVSIDTMWSSTALAAVDAGAVLVNDVSGGLADPEMLETVASLDVGYVAQHWRGHADVMDQHAVYRDVVSDVRRELERTAERALAGGIIDDRLILDPGFGFAKNAEQNWELLANLDEIASLGFPLLVGVSRKRFLAGVSGGASVDPVERDLATAVVSAALASQGLWGVRVHDVGSTTTALAVVDELRRRRR